MRATDGTRAKLINTGTPMELIFEYWNYKSGACLNLSLIVYGKGNPASWFDEAGGPGVRPLVLAMVAAFVGTVIGSRLVKKMTLRGLQRIVGWALLLAGLGMATGITLKA